MTTPSTTPTESVESSAPTKTNSSIAWRNKSLQNKSAYQRYQKAYYEAHKMEEQQYRRENPDKRRQYARTQYEKNKERYIAYATKFRLKKQEERKLEKATLLAATIAANLAASQLTQSAQSTQA